MSVQMSKTITLKTTNIAQSTNWFILKKKKFTTKALKNHRRVHELFPCIRKTSQYQTKSRILLRR